MSLSSSVSCLYGYNIVSVQTETSLQHRLRILNPEGSYGSSEPHTSLTWIVGLLWSFFSSKNGT